jgi:glutamyl-tRNA reductase
VGSAAVELAHKIFGSDLSKQSIMIIGAGKMGEACVRHLSKKGIVSVLVSNRSIERARLLADEFSGKAITMDECLNEMSNVDIVVSSTGSTGTILGREDVERVMKSRRSRRLILIDIAVPRDIEPEVQSVNGVYLYNIDDLEALVRENAQLRHKELQGCMSIIEKHCEELLGDFLASKKIVAKKRAGNAVEWMMADCQLYFGRA